MDDADAGLNFDFEGALDTGNGGGGGGGSGGSVAGPPRQSAAAAPAYHGGGGGGGGVPRDQMRRSYRQTVCNYWLKGLCMKGDACGFLHQYDKARMPMCRFFARFGECREQDCIYKHSTEDIRECNMYKLGFCPNGPGCRYRHQKKPGPPPPVEQQLARMQQRQHYDPNRFQHHQQHQQQPQQQQQYHDNAPRMGPPNGYAR